MRRKILAWVLALAMLVSNFAGMTIAYAQDPDPSGLIASYTFDEIVDDKIADEVGNNDATVITGTGAVEVPVITDDGLALNNKDSKGDTLTGLNANGISIPKSVFAGMKNISVEMEVKLDSSESSTTLMTAGKPDGTGTASAKDGYLCLINEQYGTQGLKCATTISTNASYRETITAANSVDKVPVGEWATVTYTEDEHNVVRLYINGTKVAEGVHTTGLADLCERDVSGDVNIGRNIIWGDKATDGTIRSLKVYDYALYAAAATPTSTSQPVAYYTFDDGDLTDRSGNGYTATLAGEEAVTFVDEEGHGKVLELNNSGKKRDNGASGIAIPAEVLAGKSAATILVDAYVYNINAHNVWLDISKGVGNVDDRHYLVGMLKYSNYGMNAAAQSVPCEMTGEVRVYDKKGTFEETGKWVQLAYVQDNSGVTTLYVDGELKAQGDQGVKIGDLLAVDGTTLTIGMAKFWNDTALDAKIDNIRIYDYALTTEQIMDPVLPVELPLEMYYTFDDVDGATVPDQSGNGNNATLLNGASVRNDDKMGGNVLALDNEGVNGGDAKGLALPNDAFKNMEDVTLVMDTYLSDSKTWTGLLAAGANQSNYMILANQGVKSTTYGLTNATMFDGADEERIAAPAGTSLPVGKWARMAFTHAADGAAKLYIDGELVANGKLGTSLADLAALSDNQIRIGSNHVWPDPALDGRVDNVRVYSAVLTQDQIKSLPWHVNDDPIDEDIEFPELGAHGLRGDFYLLNSGDLSFGEYKGTYIDANIASSNMEGTIKARTGASDYVAARWTGRIAAPEDGNYTFYIYSDNGVRLWVDDELVLDWWVNQWDKEQTSKKVALKKGEPHNIKLEWFEYSGGSHVTLRWKNDQSVAKKEVPANAFYLPEGFNAPLVDSIDTSMAQLDRGQENFGGTIKLVGKNLQNVDKVEIVTYSGSSLEDPVYVDATGKTETELSFAVPTDLKAMTYKLKLVAGDITTMTDLYFAVIAAPGESDRPEHPRPDWQRDQWMSLNGWWDFTFDSKEVGKTEEWFKGDKDVYDLKINVPFPWEAPMSGIANDSYRGQVWYQRNLTLDDSWLGDGKAVFLKFGAVDAKSTVYVNGTEVGNHNGGYTPFEYDITDYVHVGDNTITVWVEDKASYGDNSYPALVGKQGHNAPCGYTHTSGIWQSVYVEGRTNTYLDYAHANPKVPENTVTFDLGVVSDKAQDVTVEYNFVGKIWDEEQGKDIENGSSFSGSQTITLAEGTNKISLNTITIENPMLWDDVTPNLYYGTLTVKSGDVVLDKVDTYFGLREVTTKKYNGRNYEYIYVNGKPTFLSGLLDQGFWPEGIYTAPSEEALKYDIKAMKDRGFNMIRKHLKVEDPIQYYWADKLGMYVWQDMPHATYMNANSAGGVAPGRVIYEDALEAMLKRDYNHPSVIAIMLFNETWGINHNGPKADDGMTTHEWMTYLYNKVKETNPGMLVEDMSACNQDHIQPTDLNTFHMYPKGYANSYNDVKYHHDNTYPGSGQNFWGDYVQDGEPWLNSEFGGVAAFDKDWDVSWCFKYQTDIQRQYEKLNGYVYTEPYDIEYERNGVLSYDRRDKIFGYDEVAYGGDMSIVDLNQPNYVGIEVDPAKKMAPGAEYSATAVAVNWSGEKFENAVMKWRFDATDIYGNYITTNIGGEFDIDYPAYTAEKKTISFTLPEQKCVGTITIWIEQDGEKIAKNFVNVIVSDNRSAASIDYIDENSVVLRTDNDDREAAGVGAVTYSYAVPSGFNMDDLNSVRVIAEVSSLKNETVNHGIDNSYASQTTVGSERPSDLTVSINGVEVDTVYIPDNPRDIRGTLTLLNGLNGGSSAGNFGYLVNIRVPDDKVEAVREAILADGEINVSYAVKEDAANQNGVRMYNETTGRYAVNPTIILNPTDEVAADSVAPASGNYTAEATLSDGGSISVRGGLYNVALSGGVLSLNGEQAVVGEGKHLVAVKLFDDHIQVYADNDPVPVIDIYDYSEYTDNTVAVAGGSDLVVAPETYATSGADVVAQSDVQYVDHFNRDGSGNKNTSFEDRYTLINGGATSPSDNGSEGVWDIESGDELAVDLDWGNKAVIKDTKSADVIIEGDITLDSDKSGATNPNLGFVFRGSNFADNCDGADGYYAGIGIQTGGNSGGVNTGDGFIEVGRMHQGWSALAKVSLGQMDYGETHRLRIVAVGPRIRVYLDDETEPRVDVYDDAYSEGSVAIRGFNAIGSFDNIVVSTAPRYEADFENNTTTEWSKNGNWALENGALAASGSATALVGNAGWTDLELVTDVDLNSEDAVAGVAVRATSIKRKISGYYAVLDAANDKVQLVKASMGETAVLDEADIALGEGSYELKVRVVNNGIRVYVDGDTSPILTVYDNEYMAGQAGLVVLSGAASFDNVVVKDKFIFEDDFADGALAGWNVVSGTMSVADNTLKIERKSNGDKLWDGYATWSDYTIKARVKLDVNTSSKSNAGYVFRASDFTTGTDNLRGYVLGINSFENSPKPLEKSGLEFGDIHYGWRAIQNTYGDEFAFDPDNWYDFEVSAIGNEISVSVDGVTYYTKADEAYKYGAFGIRIFNSGIQVQNLQVIPAGEEIGEPKYDVAVTENTNAKIETNLTRAKAGETVFVYISEIADGKYFESLAVTGADNTPIETAQVTEGIPEGTLCYTFTMPEQAVNVVVALGGEADAYAVNVAEVTGATVTADKAEAAEGETVTVTIADIEEGKEFESIAVATAEGTVEVTEVTAGAEYTFVMPAEAVTVTVTLKDTGDVPSDVDKSYLEALIAAVDGVYEEERFTADSWAAFDEALAAAKDVVADDAATQEDVFNAYLDLVMARDGLTYAPDKSVLELAVDLANALLDDENIELDEESIAALEDAIAAAEEVLADDAATQEDVDAAYADVMYAIVNSVEKAQITMEMLIDLIKEAEGLGNEYTASSLVEFNEALKAAKDVVAKGEEALQDEIDKAYLDLLVSMGKLVPLANFNNLNEAYNFAVSLEGKCDLSSVEDLMTQVKEILDAKDTPFTEQTTVEDLAKDLTIAVSKLRLQQAIAAGQNLLDSIDEADYTAESVAELKAALEAAKYLDEEGIYEKEIVVAAADRLEAAMELDEVKPVDPPKPSKPSSSKGGSTSQVADSDYWAEVVEKINATEKGGKVNAKLDEGAMVPATVIDALKNKGVTVVFEIGGKDYAVNGAGELKGYNAAAVYYTSDEI
ncbi:LamG-like jellyroll fold domain-containing protein, partial [Ligaoa zhengdingensis]